MRKHALLKFFVIVFAAIMVLCVAVLFGIRSISNNFLDTRKTNRSSSSKSHERYNVEAVFTPNVEESEITTGGMDSAKRIIENRLFRQNITEYDVVIDKNQQIVVSFETPRIGTEEFDVLECLDELCEVAQLSFVRDDTNETVITNKDVKKATAQYTQDGEWVVSVELKPSGVSKFSEATKELAPIQGSISIKMDETVISSPTVNEEITDGYCMISGNFDADSAQELADKINSDPLPFAFVWDISKLRVDDRYGYEALE